ncbi:MAG: sulfatase [bacterium]|jgi:arylsulfatase A-like enzyme
MKRRRLNFPLVLVLCAMLVFGQSTIPASQKPPNVILIFMDDLGYGDLSCFGALDIHTPHLDRLAADGIRFTNFMSAQAVCSASRAALMTGSYPNRLGISGALYPGAPIGLAKEEMTIADLLKQKNYATGMFGKWHLGDVKEFLPLEQGFDEYLGIPYSNDMWPVDYDGAPARSGSIKLQYPPLPLIRNDQRIDTIRNLDDQATLTGMFTDAAIDFIKRNKRKPFFAYIAHPMPHVPINASEEFRGKSKQGLYGDVIQEVDHHVGRIMKMLKDEGLEKNTLVIFTSDNGPWFNFGEHAGSPGGFREGKGTSFEGGQRVPCIMRWPAVIPKGIVSNQLASTIDILPTLSSLTATSLPERKIDGVDISAILKGDLNITARKNFLYYYRNNSLEAVRRDNWKLVFQHSGRTYVGQAPGRNGYPGKAPENHLFYEALYDLRRDPGEQYDVSRQYPEIVAELKLLAQDAREDLGDDLQKKPGANRRNPGRLTK